MPNHFTTRNQYLLEKCSRDLAEYAEGRQIEVNKGRETPELAALLVQKYGYGMLAVLNHLSEVEDGPRIGGDLNVDGAVASINPDWRESDKRRWESKTVGLLLNTKE